LDCTCCVPKQCEQSPICTRAGGICQLINKNCSGHNFNGKCAGRDCTCCVHDGTEDENICTYTRGGWGTECKNPNQQECPPFVQWGNPDVQPGCLRDCRIDDVFPEGFLILGNDMSSAYSNFTQNSTLSEAVMNYLNNETGTPGTYSSIETNPTLTTAGNFGAQLMAAVLNFEFSLFYDPENTTNLTYTSNCTSILPCFHNTLVGDIIGFAHQIISSILLPDDVCVNSTIANWTNALALYNEEFVGCGNTTTGCIVTN
jgi:hypothetical protein